MKALPIAFVASSSLIALITLCIAWELWIAPLRPGGSWLVLKAFPLLWPLSGVIAGRRYTYQWSSMFILVYVLEGVVRATSDPAPSRWMATLEVLLGVTFFVAAIAYTRVSRPRSLPSADMTS